MMYVSGGKVKVNNSGYVGWDRVGSMMVVWCRSNMAGIYRVFAWDRPRALPIDKSLGFWWIAVSAVTYKQYKTSHVVSQFSVLQYTICWGTIQHTQE